MRNGTFATYLDTQTKKEISAYGLAQLKEYQQFEYQTRDYDSSCELARLLPSIDHQRKISVIEIYHTFVRIIRADSSGFRFGAVVTDYVQKPKVFLEEL